MKENSKNPISTLSNSINDLDLLPQNGRLFNEEAESSDTESNDDDQLKPSNIHVFSASSTLHGFSHIFASHHSGLRRFFWLVAFLASLTLFLIQVSNNKTFKFLNLYIVMESKRQKRIFDYSKLCFATNNGLKRTLLNFITRIY